MNAVQIKRIYEPVAAEDGYRVLVDRLWPRGISKDAAALDDWHRNIAPSHELRSWYGHDPKRWEEFRRRYKDELAAQTDALERLRERARKGAITLLFSAKDEVHNQAVVLKEVLEK